ncbi:ABC-2 type transport system permease protein [Asanoa hainanensis]|uniref:ABC-2 type transport system permease protein n=1 Tax=Asanoa hainanensis TaxID=560556 RepID=A0A239IVD8_9ACTN|nr:ABC transporter permease [Asanoa hainanensis]SNS97539.1 ABC-2 type transport system permease protein [Asanoa hainanensis]
MNTSSAIRLVAARELKVKIKDKTFLISTVFFLLFGLGSAVLPAIFGGGASSVAVADAATATTLRNAGLEVTQVGDEAAAEQAVRDGDVDAAVVTGGGDPKVLAMEDAPGDVVSALSVEPAVQLLDPDAVDPLLAYLVPFGFAVVFFFTSLTFGLQISQSVVEEKQTRIVEILVASVPTRALLAGKVIAGGVLALTQVALIAAVTVISLQLTDSGGLLSLVGPAIGWFVPFFVVGFVMLAALWAAAGALVNRLEDLQGVSMPLQLLVMLPFFLVVFLNDNKPVMTLLSYIPFSAPTAMPVRLFSGDAAAWEPLVALGIMVVAALALIAVGARVYEGSLLRTNGKISFGAAFRDKESRRLAEINK